MAAFAVDLACEAEGGPAPKPEMTIVHAVGHVGGEKGTSKRMNGKRKILNPKHKQSTSEERAKQRKEAKRTEATVKTYAGRTSPTITVVTSLHSDPVKGAPLRRKGAPL